MPALDRGPSLTDRVGDAVRLGIREQRFVPGEIYSVYQLAELLGVSRSPVREALLKLAEAGLVVFSRNRGFRVVLPEPRDLAEIFGIRLALEVPAVGRFAASGTAAAKAELAACMGSLEARAAGGEDAAFWADDRRLHDLVLTGSGNGRAARIVADLRATTSLLGEPTDRTRAAVCAEHRPIVDAVAAGDAEAAEAAMRAHLTSTGLLLMARAAGVPSPDAGVREVWDEVTGSR